MLIKIISGLDRMENNYFLSSNGFSKLLHGFSKTNELLLVLNFDHWNFQI